LDSKRALVRVLMRICSAFAERGVPWLAWDAESVFSCLTGFALLLAPLVALIDRDHLNASFDGWARF
jgi:hypothetical protein